MAIELDGGTDTITMGSAGVSTTYFEQADEPLAAKAGDTWRDTDTDILAYLRVDGTSRVWEGGNKTYTESYTSSRTFSNGNASVLKLFSTRTIQAGKDVEIYLRVPARDNTSSWGGLYININVKVNSTWYNLGNSGHDGGVMGDSSYDIATSHHHKHLDFIANAGVSDTSSYTVQFEVTCRAYGGTTTVNGSHDMNKTAGNLGSRGALATWGSNQNFTTLIIREVSR